MPDGLDTLTNGLRDMSLETLKQDVKANTESTNTDATNDTQYNSTMYNGDALQNAEKNGPEYMNAINALCAKYKWKPMDLLRVFQTESGNNPRAHAPGSNAYGIFQLIEGYAGECGIDYEKYKKGTAAYQVQCFENFMLRVQEITGRSIEDLDMIGLKMALFYPDNFKSGAEIIFSEDSASKAYYGNRALDHNGDETVTRTELLEHMNNQLRREEANNTPKLNA